MPVGLVGIDDLEVVDLLEHAEALGVSRAFRALFGDQIATADETFLALERALMEDGVCDLFFSASESSPR